MVSFLMNFINKGVLFILQCFAILRLIFKSGSFISWRVYVESISAISASLVTLTLMEIVLGIDNIIFLSLLVEKLPVELREKARQIGLAGATLMRLGLLSIAAWLVTLTKPFFSLFGFDFSGKSIILLLGGLFLIYKATHEIHDKLESPSDSGMSGSKPTHTFLAVVTQILIMDMVFSIDSVITAVGMTHNLTVMVVANILALAVMLMAAKSIANFVDKHPSVKILALSFLIMIGTMLVAESLSFEVPKGYIYFAMAFSLFVETLNIRVKKNKA
jgi:predicted tellurium resistance membrane protein TerC